jgi:hypothetical protein
MQKLTLSVLFFIISFSLVLAQNKVVKIEKWNPNDFEFKTTITWQFSPTSPFEVDFYAEIIGPENIKMTLPGFYDGNDTWKIRFAPTKTGKWTITTHSDVLELDNKQIEIECIPNTKSNMHGALIVDPIHPFHFIYEDGTKYFPVGYEANWLFAIDMNAAGQNLPTLNPFLDKLSGSGFNWLNINIWAYDTTWCLGKTEEADLGPPTLFPWEGTNEKPDFKKYNLKYWQHFDKVINALFQRGITTCMYLKVYNKLANLTPNNSLEDDLYFRWVIARYAAYSNVVWSLAKEAQYEKSTRYKVNRLKFIRATDSYKRLLTVHDDKLTYDLGYYNNLVDFRSSQEHKDVQATILNQMALNKWPFFMAESGYEHGPKGLKDKTFGNSNTPEEAIKNIWNIQMMGVYNAYYYTYTAWDVVRLNDNPPGYGYVKKFSDFFKKTNYWLLKTNDALVSKGRCLENPGEEYVVFQEEAKGFSFTIPQLSNSYEALWFLPLTGEYIDAGKLKTGKNELMPQAKWGKVPVVLHIKKK